MRVRRARRGDLLAVGRMADGAHWDAYSGLLHPGTISALIQRDYSPGPLGRRVAAGAVLVAEEEGRLLGFADAAVEGDRVCLRALTADPEDRRAGVAGLLLAAVQGVAPGLPLSADVILGCLPVESYLESRGLVPGEVLQLDLFGEQVVERRWWLAPGSSGVTSLSSRGSRVPAKAAQGALARSPRRRPAPGHGDRAGGCRGL